MCFLFIEIVGVVNVSMVLLFKFILFLYSHFRQDKWCGLGDCQRIHWSLHSLTFAFHLPLNFASYPQEFEERHIKVVGLSASQSLWSKPLLTGFAGTPLIKKI